MGSISQVAVVFFLFVSLLYSGCIFLGCQWFLVFYKSYPEKPRVKDYKVCNWWLCEKTIDKMGIVRCWTITAFASCIFMAMTLIINIIYMFVSCCRPVLFLFSLFLLMIHLSFGFINLQLYMKLKNKLLFRAPVKPSETPPEIGTLIEPEYYLITHFGHISEAFSIFYKQAYGIIQPSQNNTDSNKEIEVSNKIEISKRDTTRYNPKKSNSKAEDKSLLLTNMRVLNVSFRAGCLVCMPFILSGSFFLLLLRDIKQLIGGSSGDIDDDNNEVTAYTKTSDDEEEEEEDE